jgi:putative SOS response-associated peptidase YedK
MPVILSREKEATWLNPDLQDVIELKELLVPHEPEGMEVYEVSTYVNSPSNTGPVCTTPIQMQL